MNVPIVIADCITMLTFGVALVLVLRIPVPKEPAFGRTIRYFLVMALAVYAFVGFSNILEHAGITSILDTYEDYAEIMFVPLVAYILYTLSMGLQVEESQRAKATLFREHELLNGILETSPAGIVLLTGTGQLRFANDRAIELLELVPDDQGRLGLPLEFQSTTANGEGGLMAFAEDTASASRVCTVYFGGRRKTLSVSSTPLLADGYQSGWVLTFGDITEQEEARRALEDAERTYRLQLEDTVNERTAELIETNRRLELANMAKGQFLANVSHELRTPLNSVIGFTQLLLGELPGPVNAEQRVQLGMVRDSATELLTLVNDILDLERIETGNTVVEVEEFDIRALLDKQLAMMKPLAADKGVALEYQVSGCGMVRTDPGLVGQIVRNLVSNAIKFTGAGGQVTVDAQRKDGCCVLRVTDSGIGIPQEFHGRVFDAFSQVTVEDEVKPSGTGLGLTICRDLCALLGGEIDVESEPGEGSVFSVRLPCNPPEVR